MKWVGYLRELSEMWRHASIAVYEARLVRQIKRIPFMRVVMFARCVSVVYMLCGVRWFTLSGGQQAGARMPLAWGTEHWRTARNRIPYNIIRDLYSHSPYLQLRFSSFLCVMIGSSSHSIVRVVIEKRTKAH